MKEAAVLLNAMRDSGVVTDYALFGGYRRRAAEPLNISTVTLWRRIKQYGVRIHRPPGDGN